MTFEELINTTKREDICKMLGTTIPTLQRWISKDEYPDSVKIILSLMEDKSNLEKRLSLANMQILEVKQTVSNFVNSSQSLKDILD